MTNNESVVPHLQEYDGFSERSRRNSASSRRESLHIVQSRRSSINRMSTQDTGGPDYISPGQQYANGAALIPEFNEREVTVVDYAKHVFSEPKSKLTNYMTSLFPIAKWILHYNGRWLYSDLVAGITVGVVLVPQSMSYAQLAGLPAEYGLYSSFVGVFIYSFFATSKDVSIGPVAVMSLQVSKVIQKVQEQNGDKFSAPEIATFLSLICGGIAFGIGILRLGFILEFISIPAVMGFMSGSAFSIITGQVPSLMGFNSKVNTRDSTYLVVVNSLKNLKHLRADAAFGLTALFLLYVWKFSCAWCEKRYPRRKLWFFYAAQLRNALILIISTAISWGIIHPKVTNFKGPREQFKGPFSILGVVPSGLRHVGVMSIPQGIIGEMASEIPVSVIILLLEHIAIAKSFGRVNDYKIIPDQEVIAIGVNNLIGTFFSAYPATGSFSRSALKAKCGVRTPLAGIFTGGVVLLALYCLTEAFFYIPKATLSAVIIHAVSDLIANYKVTWSFWNISPLDCGIFLVAVIITVFSSIENGIYFAIAASGVILLFRVARPQGVFLGKIKVAEVINPIIEGDSFVEDNSSILDNSSDSQDLEIHQVLPKGASYQATDCSNLKIEDRASKKSLASDIPTAQQLAHQNPHIKFHTRWVPLTKENINNELNVQPPPPGVLVFKPVESLTYPNVSVQVDRISDEAKRLTRRGKPFDTTSAGSRPWNDPGPLQWKFGKPKWFSKDKKEEKRTVETVVDERPLLRLVHIDLSSVASIDVTSIQALIDLRKALNRYADREVEFHFSGILSPWIRRGLISAGFGSYTAADVESDGAVSATTYVNIGASNDLESASASPYYAVIGTDTPFFHLDIPDYS